MIDLRGKRTRADYSKKHKNKIKEKIYSPFLSFIVARFYKVTKNTKLGNAKPLLLG